MAWKVHCVGAWVWGDGVWLVFWVVVGCLGVGFGCIGLYSKYSDRGSSGLSGIRTCAPLLTYALLN